MIFHDDRGARHRPHPAIGNLNINAIMSSALRETAGESPNILITTRIYADQPCKRLPRNLLII